MMTNYFLYKKPATICHNTEVWEPLINSGNFTDGAKKLIASKITDQGFTLRLAVNDDILNIEKLITKCYPPQALRDSNPYDFYRFINFGHGLLVEDKDNKLIGCLFEEGYDTPDRTSYSLRLAIDKEANSRDLGTLLVEYSTMLAMERGSMSKRGLLMANNFISAHILINKLGWVCDGFYPDLQWVRPSFTIFVPLTVENYACNRIDMIKLIHFLKEKQANKDYLLTDWDDNSGFKKIYEQKEFMICALLRPGLFDNEKYQYVSLPINTLVIK